MLRLILLTLVNYLQTIDKSFMILLTSSKTKLHKENKLLKTWWVLVVAIMDNRGRLWQAFMIKPIIGQVNTLIKRSSTKCKDIIQDQDLILPQELGGIFHRGDIKSLSVMAKLQRIYWVQGMIQWLKIKIILYWLIIQQH